MTARVRPGFGIKGRRSVFAIVLAAPSLLATAELSAQQIAPQVNPGAIGRQNQQTIRSLSELRDIPRITGPLVSGGGASAPTQVSPGGPTFVLREVQFSHSALLPQDEIQALAAPYIGKRVDLSKLYTIVAAVNALYAKRGFVNASAVLPPQHVADGIVQIQLVEGKLGKVDVVDNKYIPKDFFLGRLPMRPGEVVDVPALSQGIAAFNRLNDVQVRASLQPGAQFGQTDVTLTAVEPPRDSLDLMADNWGVSSTGTWEGAALYRRRSTLTADDSLTLYGIGNPGDLSGSVAYELPVDSYGGRLGASYAYTHTRILNGPYQSLDIAGRSQTGNAHFTQPFYASENWLLSGVVNWWTVDSVNDEGDVLQSTDVTNKGGPGVEISYVDATKLADVTLQYAYGGTSFQVIDTFDRFNILSGTYRFQYALPAGFSANLAGAWQYAPTSVLSPDQLLTLGGATSVRGYDANLVAGFSGGYEQFDLHKDVGSLLKGLDLFGFVDAGSVSSPHTDHKTLVGLGVGASYTMGHWATLQVETAWPLERVVANQSNFEVYVRLVFHAI